MNMLLWHFSCQTFACCLCVELNGMYVDDGYYACNICRIFVCLHCLLLSDWIFFIRLLMFLVLDGSCRFFLPLRMGVLNDNSTMWGSCDKWSVFTYGKEMSDFGSLVGRAISDFCSLMNVHEINKWFEDLLIAKWMNEQWFF